MLLASLRVEYWANNDLVPNASHLLKKVNYTYRVNFHRAATHSVKLTVAKLQQICSGVCEHDLSSSLYLY
jgi:hypothetical protein